MTMDTGASSTGREATILIIENDPSDRLLLEKVLSSRGYRCLSVMHGREALDLLDRVQVDLILTDLLMPVLDGQRTAQLIRSRPGMERVPIVAVTAYPPDEARGSGPGGYDEYLLKPFKPRQLLDLVERLLGSWTS
ncbi:MAG: response regulator [Thermogemmatispora sp.]|uniref:response regulator n=1 Tax=Thermogemmatispora sp. TaxID=1968838 RepID=UPI002634C6F8|nr:response regulator [Thermogemmatispora sp.]MBX5456072.1 response regulator [Thermogemmatispora sp.]